MNIKSEVSNALSTFKANWKIPAEGRYMSIKEIASLSGGGIGVRLIVYCVNQLIISTNNNILANTIGIESDTLYFMQIISILFSFPLTALRASIIDNAQSMKGKYRPYILSMGLPTVIIAAIMVLLPYDSMEYFEKCFWVLLCNIGFQFFFYFMSDAYDSLINVLSPNSIERSDVLSIKSIVENLSPSIVGIFLPIVAKWITGDDKLFDMRVYRILFPPLLFVGFLISIIVYVNTEEKYVKPKNYIPQVRFGDAFRAVAANKYFWIISLAGWMGFLEGAFGNIMSWMYNYQEACSAGQYAVITAISGNAAFWPNIVAPFFIRRFGKKKIIVISNLMNIGLIAIMLPVVKMTGRPHIIWLLLLCSFLNQFITALGHLITPSINADVRDFQQYISGERIDGMFAAVGLIGNVIGLVTNSVLPMIYKNVGLNRETAVALGYSAKNVYDVLYNREYFINISSVLVVASIIGAVMNVIPLFFYDFTEAKQKAMIRVLKLRAVFEDKESNCLTEEKRKEAVEIIINAQNNFEKPLTKGKTKKEREENEEIEISSIVMKELSRYETAEGKFSISLAKKTVGAGLNFEPESIISKQEIKELPRKSAEEKIVYIAAKKLLRDIKYAHKTARRYYPNGITEFNNDMLAALYKEEYEADVALRNALNRLKQAKDNKENEAIYVEAVRSCRKKSNKIKHNVKKANKQNAIYYSAAKPFLDAEKTLRQYENYKNYTQLLTPQ